MSSLRQIIAQGRKRLGLLVGAGAPAGILDAGGAPLIPAVAGLTTYVLDALKDPYEPSLSAIKGELKDPNIENILSRVRSLSAVIGTAKVHGLDADGYKALSQSICAQIGKIVDKDLPTGPSPYSDFVNWISGADRDHSVEIFTTNYDLLFEKGLERAKVPYFDGFSGSSEQFLTLPL